MAANNALGRGRGCVKALVFGVNPSSRSRGPDGVIWTLFSFPSTEGTGFDYLKVLNNSGEKEVMVDLDFRAMGDGGGPEVIGVVEFSSDREYGFEAIG